MEDCIHVLNLYILEISDIIYNNENEGLNMFHSLSHESK